MYRIGLKKSLEKFKKLHQIWVLTPTDMSNGSKAMTIIDLELVIIERLSIGKGS